MLLAASCRLPRMPAFIPPASPSTPSSGGCVHFGCPDPRRPCCVQQHVYALPAGFNWLLNTDLWRAQCLRLSSGDQVTVTPFQPPRDGFGAALLSLELDYVSKRRAAAATEYDAKALAKHILARYVGQVRRWYINLVEPCLRLWE